MYAKEDSCNVQHILKEKIWHINKTKTLSEFFFLNYVFLNNSLVFYCLLCTYIHTKFLFSLHTKTGTKFFFFFISLKIEFKIRL